ncbi:type II toxin-antitoxin system RelE/ParE family toxin [Glaesserella parasuis]|uniref:Type II toxin-antitoxin system RelE/ParE family toxin n=1 Tax=Glaesserella parasuis TaxID=738 RepID=A0AA42EFS3_GLAPU|nr:type II toxin-antitoxin system RelE/ParE family toxin [Glaesserella parasuis]KEZ23990.1 Plasmid maintenance system killer protein [Glaesserella parasuis]MDD2168862.1 type II toxin-antitoxin system RelE/ParE family toxin [Glaesserella parasuis]MDG6833384.1 type II toxin-antitoxin system RelE/ParE family toxin [Glaesserella parasuis]MDO9665368.1 type II toxin-antitoxin system RelE/ParE family toxin [Glaesserella parasuis]MDO9768382.1 type II toxin-antitoxin system RelE/ParE family toxin [Glae
MILSFKHKGLKLFFETGSTAGIQANHASKLRLQLATLENAETVSAMNFPGWDLLENAETVSAMNFPGWDLHPLQGNLVGHWSVKVNKNWRLTFKFENGHAEIVDYQDYH